MADTTPEETNGVTESPQATGSGGLNFLEDDRKDMTLGRRIALSLMNRGWYNPQSKKEEGVSDNDGEADNDDNSNSKKKVYIKPSLEKAWAYFEHFALNRYVVDEVSNEMQKAEPGENDVPTKLYNPFTIPHDQLGDFGMGIGLYFSTLRLIFFLVLVSGLISIANVHFFASEDYQSFANRDSIYPRLVRGSAICTKTSWVACPTCTCATSDRVTAQELRQQDILPTKRCQVKDGLVFTLKNECGEIPLYAGMANYATIILFFLVTSVYLGGFLKRQEVKFDEDEQTAQDYSVQVENPPDSATDPAEWHKFFKENFGAHVTVCTCAVENDLLVETLVERRECLRNIELSLEPGESTDELNIARMAALIERERSFLAGVWAIVVKGIPEYYARMVSLSAKVKGLAQLSYPCTNVFLTFETEKAQRDVLNKLSVGILQAEKNIKTAVTDPKYLFRGEHVLFVSEPDEPSTIRWQNLNVTAIQRIKSVIITSLITCAGIVVVFVAVSAADSVSLVAGAYTITAFNVAFPVLAKVLTNSEPHPSESAVQTSLYFKIAFFRWVNTAIVITIVTPFTDTLLVEGGLINKVYQQFFSEIVVSTALQITDIMGHVNRHILAPRANCQDAMNLKFKGTEWNLAERYTDMTKILFLCVWYCSIFPGAYLLCAFSLFLKYAVDRFSLMRTWERAPHFGNAIAWISHTVFFPLALMATSIMSSYYWAGFPYDNLCAGGDLENDSYIGSHNLTDVGVQIVTDTVEYEYCRQNFFGKGGIFPFVHTVRSGGATWMDDDQKLITSIFGWSSVVFTAAILIKFAVGWIKGYHALHTSIYKPVGDDQNIPFSTLDQRSGYVPLVNSPLFSFPLIACASDEIDEELFDWKDPDRPYLYYDLAEDANLLLKGSPFSYRDGFSHVSWYPPPEVIPTRVASLSTETTPKAIETEDGSWECGTIGSAKTMDA